MQCVNCTANKKSLIDMFDVGYGLLLIIYFFGFSLLLHDCHGICVSVIISCVRQDTGVRVIDTMYKSVLAR